VTAIGLHSPVRGTRDYNEPSAFQERDREYDVCPGCGKRKSVLSRSCRKCNNYAQQTGKRLMRQFAAWLARQPAEKRRAVREGRL